MLCLCNVTLTQEAVSPANEYKKEKRRQTWWKSVARDFIYMTVTCRMSFAWFLCVIYTAKETILLYTTTILCCLWFDVEQKYKKEIFYWLSYRNETLIYTVLPYFLWFVLLSLVANVLKAAYSNIMNYLAKNHLV